MKTFTFSHYSSKYLLSVRVLGLAGRSRARPAAWVCEGLMGEHLWNKDTGG